MNPDYLPDHLFKAAYELRLITDGQFTHNVQRVVDGGAWRSWGPEWAREVQLWVDGGVAHY